MMKKPALLSVTSPPPTSSLESAPGEHGKTMAEGMDIDGRAAEAPREVDWIAQLWDNVRVWRSAIGVFATLSLALLVAAIIARDPPDFSDRSIVAVVRDGERHPVWAIRLARFAHEIAADSLRDEPAPPGRVYQLWLLVPDRTGPRQLGLLPSSGRKRIAVSPENARLLAGAGELVVTVEPTGGSPVGSPSGQKVFWGTLDRAG